MGVASARRVRDRIECRETRGRLGGPWRRLDHVWRGLQGGRRVSRPRFQRRERVRQGVQMRPQEVLARTHHVQALPEALNLRCLSVLEQKTLGAFTLADGEVWNSIQRGLHHLGGVEPAPNLGARPPEPFKVQAAPPHRQPVRVDALRPLQEGSRFRGSKELASGCRIRYFLRLGAPTIGFRCIVFYE